MTRSAERPKPPTTIRWTPRRIRPQEAAVIERLLCIDPDRELGERSLADWLAAVHELTVREGCDCGCDSLFFDDPHDLGRPIANGVGGKSGQNEVELILWARDSTLTFLELEPRGSTRRPVRLPPPESIGPVPSEPDWLDD